MRSTGAEIGHIPFFLRQAHYARQISGPGARKDLRHQGKTNARQRLSPHPPRQHTRESRKCTRFAHPKLASVCVYFASPNFFIITAGLLAVWNQRDETMKQKAGVCLLHAAKMTP